MKNVDEYINSLTTEQLVKAYREEYIVFKRTGICPDGVIRNIAELIQKVMGEYHIDFAERLFMQKCAEVFYTQNTPEVFPEPKMTDSDSWWTGRNRIMTFASWQDAHKYWSEYFNKE